MAQYIFACLFTVELALQWGAAGWKFFLSDEWVWSWFDLFVVLTSIWEVVLDMLYIGTAGDGSFSGFSGMSGLRTFRIIRITRIAKTIRLLRMFRMVLALRTLIASIVNTLKSLLWALVLLGLIVYVFSVLFCQAVSSHMLDPLAAQLPERELMLAQRHFASLGDSYLSLSMSVAGGVSWEEPMAPIKQKGPAVPVLQIHCWNNWQCSQRNDNLCCPVMTYNSHRCKLALKQAAGSADRYAILTGAYCSPAAYGVATHGHDICPVCKMDTGHNAHTFWACPGMSDGRPRRPTEALQRRLGWRLANNHLTMKLSLLGWCM